MTTPDPPQARLDALRAVLTEVARQGATVTYRDLAQAAGIPGPHSIHKTAEALEALAEADHAAGAPLVTALVVSRARGGLPAPGFFDLLARLGRYNGPAEGPQAAMAHQLECRRVWQAHGAADT